MAVATLKATTETDIRALIERSRSGKPSLANNTWAEINLRGEVEIWYHRTPIVTFKNDGTVVFDCNGWDTMTTLGRLDQVALSLVGGHVGKIGGEGTYTCPATKAWYNLRHPLTIDAKDGRVLLGGKEEHHNGWSNFDTWACAAWVDNVDECLHRASRRMDDQELRELFRANRAEIGYGRISRVNLDEIVTALSED